jgi:hypothetical protein
MLKCTVQGCTDECFPQCFKRITLQRAEAIRQLGIVDKPVRNVDNVCSRCGRKFIHAKRNGVDIMICSCRVE